MSETQCPSAIQWLDDTPAAPCVLPRGHDGSHWYKPAGQARADRGEADLIERVAFAMHLRMGGTAEQWQSTDPNAAMDREGYHHLAVAAVEVLRGEGR